MVTETSYFCLLIVCVCVCGYVHRSAGALGGQKKTRVAGVTDNC